MRQVCYICDTVYGEKGPLMDKGETHGLCPVHYKTELKRLKKAIRQMESTLRLPGINTGACSGLTLSGASSPRLQRGGLAPSNGSTHGCMKSMRKDWWDRNDWLHLSLTTVNHFKRELDQTPYRALPWIRCGSGIFWSFTGKRLLKKTIDEVSFKGCWKPTPPCPIGQTGFIPDSPFTGEGFPPSLLDKGGKGGIWISLT